MHESTFFEQAIIFLLAAVVAVPIAKRLGLGSVLGYLLAGVTIGPFVLGWIGDEGSDIMHFAEFGVVMMLFLIGLELKPSLLWSMRQRIFGLGGLQMIITTIVFAGIGLTLSLNWQQSVAIGLTLALSSTAIVLQSLAEKGELNNQAGQATFSVLLFQDIAVIPALAILPLLAPDILTVDHAHANAYQESWVAGLEGWQQLLLIISIVAGIIFIGRFLVRHLFRIIAGTGMREMFTATSLLMIIGIALSMDMVGLSPALGAFLAGVVLADNEYRHELEAVTEPFKALLLGLFFIAVGTSVNFQLLIEKPVLILALLGILLVVKFTVLLGLSRIFGLRSGEQMLFSFALAQTGEFAFVMIAFSTQNNLFSPEISGILLILVALSMAITPLLLLLNESLVQPLFRNKLNTQPADQIEEKDSSVIIAGFGRFGVSIGRFLLANDIHPTVLDNNPANIHALRKFGFKVYYGDAGRGDLLESAGIATARLLIIAIDDQEKANELADFVKNTFPKVKILARARNIQHAFELYKLKVDGIRLEVFDSAIELGIQALRVLDFHNYRAHRAARTFKFHNQSIIQELYQLWGKDKKKYIQEARRFKEQLEQLLSSEEQHPIHESDHAWDVESLKEEIVLTAEKTKSQTE